MLRENLHVFIYEYVIYSFTYETQLLDGGDDGHHFTVV